MPTKLKEGETIIIHGVEVTVLRATTLKFSRGKVAKTETPGVVRLELPECLRETEKPKESLAAE